MSKINYKKELEEFDEMLSNMTGDEVMEVLKENGYGKIKSHEESGYTLKRNNLIDEIKIIPINKLTKLLKEYGIKFENNNNN